VTVVDSSRRRPPRLTFACELDSPRLVELLADDAVVHNLRGLGARVTLMLSDLSDARADVVARLNEADVPVVAVPLVSVDAGYYFTADNVPQAEASYEQWKAWTVRHGLRWDGVGLDIEPEARIYQQILANPWGLLPLLAPRLHDRERPVRARIAYSALVDRIHADGWRVENYQFPLIADERRAGSTLLQRVMGLVDLTTDREVWMLYNSFLRRIGPGVLWSYGPDAPAIAVGTTGGGPDVPGHPQMPTLSWDELARDLLLAHHWSDDLYIHSLEGSVWQGFLPRLHAFDWGPTATAPDGARLADTLRRTLRGVLWANTHPWPLLAATVTGSWLLRRSRRPR
jgi:hypothetical protein